MMRLSDVARWTGGKLVGTDAEVVRIVTDSRAVEPGDLFVALAGERFDAHEFVADVLARGAAGVVVREGAAVAHGAYVEVGDTRLALGRLAAGWADTLSVVRVGVTGSNGKTTVKEMLAAILCAHAGNEGVLATAGNLNNDIGLPLTLLKLQPAHRYAVLEMGMNHSGEIRYLSRLARPQVALVNNAMRAHLGQFSGVEAIARAKAEIFEGLPDDGVAIVNADDPHAGLFREAAGSHRIITFGLGSGDVTARDVVLMEDSSRFLLVTPEGECDVHLPSPGEHNVRNALAAAAVASGLGVPLRAVASGLGVFGGAKGRLQRRSTQRGVTVIDDSYNANPDSMKAGLAVLGRAMPPRWFVMGDIGELGETAPALHAEVGVFAREQHVDVLLALGTLSAEAVAAFGEGALHFDSIEALNAHLDAHLPAGATVLVKGSRFMRMERVVDHLLAAEQENKVGV